MDRQARENRAKYSRTWTFSRRQLSTIERMAAAFVLRGPPMWIQFFRSCGTERDSSRHANDGVSAEYALEPGCDANPITKSGGGVINMRERAPQLHGKFEFDSERGVEPT